LSGLNDLLFELSSDNRLDILGRLRGSPSKVSKLAEDMGITNQECSRHIVRLGEAGLTAKNVDGLYALTPYGQQVLLQLKGIEFTSKYRAYFREHTMMGIPESFIGRIGELSNCTLVDDIMVVFKDIESMIAETQEYMLRVTDRYLLTTMPTTEKMYQRGAWQHLLDPEDMVIPPDFEPGPIIREATRKRLFLDWTLPRVDLFLAMNEKRVTSLSFPLLNGKFDYTGFASADPAFHKWCKELFEYYWAMAKPKTREWLGMKLEESRKRARR